MTASDDTPRRLRRSESFLGIHFDFHAGKDCTEIGRDVTPEMIAGIIERVHPDYIQCDCKGHPGIASYPTKVGTPAPGFARDMLRIWREVTAQHGVALYMHYSGVFDKEAVAQHPTWAEVSSEGHRSKQNTSVFGPYVDQLLIPQLIELSDVYGVDGVWVDGECWAMCQDYGAKVIREFQRQTGVSEVPRKPTDPFFFEYTEFCREGFRRYLRHYVDAIHDHDPNFQVASNWAFTSFMPEPVSANVDFISGDYSLQNSVNEARLEARCIANQGQPWDLMAWSFSGKWGEKKPRATKTAVQLQQEAAVVLALGGGFQAYFKQLRDGSINEWTMGVMGEVAPFCRARQRVCHRARPVPQVGVILSTSAFYRKNERVFSPWGGILAPLKGILFALLDAQYSVEVVMEHHLAGRLADYPLLVIPEWEHLASDLVADLRDYVRSGGALLVIGARAAEPFQDILGVEFVGEPVAGKGVLGFNGTMCPLPGLTREVRAVDARLFGNIFPQNNFRGASQAAASVTRYGKGQIAALYGEFGERYVNGRSALARDFLGAVVAEIFPEPLVEVAGSHTVDVCLNRSHGTLAVNLVNTAGPHADTSTYTYDEVPPIGPLEVRVRTGEKPTSVVQEPEGITLPFTFAEGVTALVLPKLSIHTVLLIE